MMFRKKYRRLRDKLLLLKKGILSLFFRINSVEKQTLFQISNEFPHVFSIEHTIDLIINNGLSIARFGDAEFDIARKKNINDEYQLPSDKLSQRLLTILSEGSNEKLLVCIPPYYCSFNNINNYYKNISFWEWYWLNNYKSLSEYFGSNSYGNSFISRSSVFNELPVGKINKIWENRKIVFVIGKNSRFVLDKRLFGNVLSYTIIESKPVNAFSDYDNIMDKCLEYPQDVLFLIALGPTATVLSYDLSNYGYQSIDIGHISNSYREYLKEEDKPESLPLIVE